jgi:malate synthase
VIKTRRDDPEAVFPDRGDVGMEQPFLRAYTQLTVKTCHRRGIHALGGMAAQIPNRRDPEANERSLAKVRADKEREAEDGHDGTWVAHPDLVPVARDAFRARFCGPNQLSVSRADVEITEQDLLTIPEGPRTLNGLRGNVRVGLRYLESWLRGVGCVPLYGLMEDAATAEISRTQLWQWMRHETLLEDHLPVTQGLIQSSVRSEMERIETELGSYAFARGRFAEAERLFTVEEEHAVGDAVQALELVRDQHHGDSEHNPEVLLFQSFTAAPLGPLEFRSARRYPWCG